MFEMNQKMHQERRPFQQQQQILPRLLLQHRNRPRQRAIHSKRSPMSHANTAVKKGTTSVTAPTIPTPPIIAIDSRSREDVEINRAEAKGNNPTPLLLKIPTTWVTISSSTDIRALLQPMAVEDSPIDEAIIMDK